MLMKEYGSLINLFIILNISLLGLRDHGWKLFNTWRPINATDEPKWTVPVPMLWIC